VWQAIRVTFYTNLTVNSHFAHNCFFALFLGYTFVMADPKDNYQLYMENAREMLGVAKSNLANDYYTENSGKV